MVGKPKDVLPGVYNSRIYIAVDEGGDIGSNMEGDWYILCASSVKDRRRFADATRHFGFSKEMKFRKNKKRREEVLRMAAPAMNAVYYVAVRKDQFEFNPDEQKAIHRNALGRLADMVLAGERSERLDIEIDENSLIDDHEAERLFETNRLSGGKDVNAEVVDSYDNYEMQTHDFIVGSIGKLYNRYDDRYVEMLDCPKYAYLTSTDHEKDISGANRSHTDRADARRRSKYQTGDYKNAPSEDDEYFEEGEF